MLMSFADPTPLFCGGDEQYGLTLAAKLLTSTLLGKAICKDS